MIMVRPEENFDIALVNGHILADPDSGQVRQHGMTLIKNNNLEEVNIPRDHRICADEVIDCSNCLIMPGFINCHSHSGMGLLRGLADDMPLEIWLQRFIFPVEKKWVKPDFVYLGSLLSMAEMVLNGITTCADGYYFMESTAQAAIDLGMRAVVAQGVLDVPTPDTPDPQNSMRRVLEFLESCPVHQLIYPAIFCHSPYLCNPITLKRASKLARDRSLSLFCHVAETKTEVQAICSRYNMPPVAHLQNLGILGENFIAVHVTNITAEEMDMIAETKTKVIHCPESNMKLASGAAQVTQLLRRNTIVGIGTDSAASNNDLDMISEMKTAALLAKLVSSDPLALDAKTVVRMATIEGARALGLETKIGSLKPGKHADVVVIDMAAIHLTPMYNMISHLVYCAKSSDVRDVIINGHVVVRNRVLQTMEQTQIRDRASETSREIVANL